MQASELLPIGSVVLLRGGQKKLMIIGLLQGVQDGENRKAYDYIGVLFPEGFMNVDSLVLFNHNQIDIVSFIGCDNEERQVFMERVSDVISFIESNKNDNRDTSVKNEAIVYE